MPQKKKTLQITNAATDEGRFSVGRYSTAKQLSPVAFSAMSAEL